MTKAIEDVILNKEQVKLLDSIYPDLSQLKSSLEGVIHPSIIEKIELLMTKMNVLCNERWEKEEEDFDKEYEKLSNIANKNKLISTWSFDAVKSSMMKEKIPFKIQSLKYESWGTPQKIVFDVKKTMTWLELWKAADQMIKASGDSHHTFIEDFNLIKGKTEDYELFCGS